MIIYTKKNREGNWVCFTTLFGYDYSFDSISIDGAQNQMRQLLSKNKVKGAKWTEPINTYIEADKKIEYGLGYNKGFVDRNPFG